MCGISGKKHLRRLHPPASHGCVASASQRWEANLHRAVSAQNRCQRMHQRRSERLVGSPASRRPATGMSPPKTAASACASGGLSSRRVPSVAPPALGGASDANTGLFPPKPAAGACASRGLGISSDPRIPGIAPTALGGASNTSTGLSAQRSGLGASSGHQHRAARSRRCQ